MRPAALSDRHRFTTIAHATHRFLSPLSHARARALADGLAPAAGARVLDVGCGPAAFLLDMVERYPVRGIGIDHNAAFIELARAAAQRRGLLDRVALTCKPLLEAIDSEPRFEVIVCLGSSQAVGTPLEALRWVFARLVPGGVALFADGCWRQPPAAEYLAALGGSEGEMTTHAGNAELARSAGFRVLATAMACDDEWDEYEGRYCAAMERWLDAHPDDPDAPAFAARIRAWHDAYLRWGRATLGFGYYTLLKPLHPG